MLHNPNFYGLYRNPGSDARIPLAPTDSDSISMDIPITPPASESDPASDADSVSESILSTAVHVLSTEATALSYLSRLYATDPVSRVGFVRATEAIASSYEKGGKTVVIGVGKSGKIGEKLVATLNSLGLCGFFLHPVEALHGDLGVIRNNDVLLLITFSGNTPELLALLPHLPAHLPLIALTSRTTSLLTRERPSAILLPAPIPESEESTFGISAPTTSTTVAVALADALALAVARRVHTAEGASPKEVFKRNHPGGAIGLGAGSGVVRILDLAVRLSDIPIIGGEGMSDLQRPESPVSSGYSSASGSECDNSYKVMDALLLSVRSSKGWVRTEENEVIPPRRLQRVRNVNAYIHEPGLGLVVNPEDVVRVAGETSVEEVRKWVLANRTGCDGALFQTGCIIGIVIEGEIIGVVEVEELLEKTGN